MSTKQKKKRTKKYTGLEARVSTPKVTRVSAEERSRLKEWWLPRRQLIRLCAIIGGFVGLLVLIIIGIVGLF